MNALEESAIPTPCPHCAEPLSFRQYQIAEDGSITASQHISLRDHRASVGENVQVFCGRCGGRVA